MFLMTHISSHLSPGAQLINTGTTITLEVQHFLPGVMWSLRSLSGVSELEKCCSLYPFLLKFPATCSDRPPPLAVGAAHGVLGHD